MQGPKEDTDIKLKMVIAHENWQESETLFIIISSN